jgi:hypothetical protein
LEVRGQRVLFGRRRRIGRDDTLALAQNFSRIYGDSLKIALHNYIDNQQQSPQTPLQDGEYIFWGHNGNDLEPDYAQHAIGSAIYSFYGRVWKVKQTVNNLYTLDYQFNVKDRTKAQNLKLFIAPDESFTAWETAVYSPETVENGKVSFRNISAPQTADAVFYLTFGYNADDVDGTSNTNSPNNSNAGNATGQNAVSEILGVFTEATWQPNPVVSSLTIDYKLTRGATIWFSVHNNTGNPVCQTSPTQKPAGQNRTIIPMGHLLTGTYTVYVHVDDMVMVQTVIKK